MPECRGGAGRNPGLCLGWADPRGDRRHAPVFERPAQDLEAPLEMPDTQRWLKPNWWQAARRRAMSLFRAHAPEFLQELQTTEQQVHGAVAEYQRRYDQLARLVREAEGIASELAGRSRATWARRAEPARRRPRQSARKRSVLPGRNWTTAGKPRPMSNGKREVFRRSWRTCGCAKPTSMPSCWN